MPESTIETKEICADCIGEHYLSAYILHDGRPAKCCICNGNVLCLSATKIALLIDKAITSKFEISDPFFSAEEIDLTLDEVLIELNLPPAIGEFLKDALRNSPDLNERAREWFDFYAEDLTYMEREPSAHQFEELWDNYCSSLLHESRHFNLQAKQILDDILEPVLRNITIVSHQPIYQIEPHQGRKFYRARKATERNDVKRFSLSPVTEFASAPLGHGRPFRLNSDGITVLYCATNRETAIAELRPSRGDFVATCELSLLRTITVFDLTRLQEIDLREQPSPFDPQYSVIMGRFQFFKTLNEKISKTLTNNEERFGYIPTQAFADYVANHVDPVIDGIIYSSAQAEGENLALFARASIIEWDQTIQKNADIMDQFEIHYHRREEPMNYIVSIGPVRELQRSTPPPPVPTSTSPALKVVPGGIVVHAINAIQISKIDFQLEISEDPLPF